MCCIVQSSEDGGLHCSLTSGPQLPYMSHKTEDVSTGSFQVPLCPQCTGALHVLNHELISSFPWEHERHTLLQNKADVDLPPSWRNLLEVELLFTRHSADGPQSQLRPRGPWIHEENFVPNLELQKKKHQQQHTCPWFTKYSI